MNKIDMIASLKSQYISWYFVHDMFTDKRTCDNQIHPVNGWYMSFDGPSIEEMYLTDVHPCSDESGDVITIEDFKEY
jgi:hypothetical protein